MRPEIRTLVLLVNTGEEVALIDSYPMQQFFVQGAISMCFQWILSGSTMTISEQKSSISAQVKQIYGMCCKKIWQWTVFWDY